LTVTPLSSECGRTDCLSSLVPPFFFRYRHFPPKTPRADPYACGGPRIPSLLGRALPLAPSSFCWPRNCSSFWTCRIPVSAPLRILNRFPFNAHHKGRLFDVRFLPFFLVLLGTWVSPPPFLEQTSTMLFDPPIMLFFLTFRGNPGPAVSGEHLCNFDLIVSWF